MSINLNILTFAMDYWDGPWMSRHNVMTKLALRNKVLFASPPFYWKKIFRDFGKLGLRKSGLKKVNNNLYTFIPPKCLPINYRFKNIDKFIADLRIAMIKRILRKLDFKDVILYLWNPKFADMVGKFNEKLVVYHVHDQFSGYASNTPEEARRIEAVEDQLLRKADLVFANGEMLLETKNRYGNAFNIPSGVDYEAYSKAAEENLSIPDDIKQIPKPIIGYVGRINPKVDFKLLWEISCTRPDWSIVLMGPVLEMDDIYLRDVKMLEAKENVYFLGNKEVSTLPNYLKAIDVCLMCYILNDWVRYGYPLKMHEYLAAGKPVVSSDLPTVREFANVVKIATTPEEWIKSIEDSIKDTDSQEIKTRIEVARENTWNKRLETITDLINQKLVT